MIHKDSCSAVQALKCFHRAVEVLYNMYNEVFLGHRRSGTANSNAMITDRTSGPGLNKGRCSL